MLVEVLGTWPDIVGTEGKGEGQQIEGDQNMKEEELRAISNKLDI